MNEHLNSQAGISTAAQRLLNDRPELWEYRLFAQVLIDEVSMSAPQRMGRRLAFARLHRWRSSPGGPSHA